MAAAQTNGTQYYLQSGCRADVVVADISTSLALLSTSLRRTPATGSSTRVLQTRWVGFDFCVTRRENNRVSKNCELSVTNLVLITRCRFRQMGVSIIPSVHSWCIRVRFSRAKLRICEFLELMLRCKWTLNIRNGFKFGRNKQNAAVTMLCRPDLLNGNLLSVFINYKWKGTMPSWSQTRKN